MIISYAEFTSIVVFLSGIVGSIFDSLDSLVLLNTGIIDITILDVFIAALYLIAIADLINWFRGLGGGESQKEPSQNVQRPKARNTKTGKVYWK